MYSTCGASIDIHMAERKGVAGTRRRPASATSRSCSDARVSRPQPVYAGVGVEDLREVLSRCHARDRLMAQVVVDSSSRIRQRWCGE